jgi:hypothetical protein
MTVFFLQTENLCPELLNTSTKTEGSVQNKIAVIAEQQKVRLVHQNVYGTYNEGHL